MKARLKELAERRPVIGDIRGEGLLVGVEFTRDAATRERFAPELQVGIRIREAARRRGLLLRAAHWMVAFAPPLTTTESEVDLILDLFTQSLEEVLEAPDVRKALAR